MECVMEVSGSSEEADWTLVELSPEKARASPSSLKLKCSLCGELVGSGWVSLRRHVAVRHLPSPPFACRLCDHSLEYPSKAKGHAVAQHCVEEEIWERAFRVRQPSLQELKRLAAQCFPTSKGAGLAEEGDGEADAAEAGLAETDEGTAATGAAAERGAYRGRKRPVVCSLCAKAVEDSRNGRRRHVAVHHLPRPPFVCRLCPSRQTRSMASSTHERIHAKAAHGRVEDWRLAFDITPPESKELNSLIHRCFRPA